jgi:tetratricopeptide (TPR) repeat protein
MNKTPKRNIAGVNSGYKLHTVLLFIIPVLLYSQAFGFNFVFHDDDIIILQNSEVLKNFEWRRLLLSDAWLLKKQIELYRPLQSITYAIDYYFSGTSPKAYHIHNVLVFALGIVLLYFVLIKFKIPARHSFIVSLLYSVHYLFANTVCWIPARGDLYLFLFSMLVMLVWIKALYENKVYLYFLSALLYFFALLAKESAVVLLPVLLLLTYQAGKLDFKNTSLYLFAIVSLAFNGLYFYMRSLSIVNTPNIFTLEGLLYNIRIIPEQTGKFFIPAFFSVMPAFSTTLTITGSIVILVLTSMIVLFRKQLNMDLIFLGTALFLLPTLPALVYKPQFTGFAYDYLDHRLFFPAIGLMLIAYTLIASLIKKNISVSYLYILSIVMAAYTFSQARNYKDYKAYYTNATQTNPQSGLAWMNFGILSARENDYAKAFEYFYNAKEVVPDNIELRMKIADSHLTLKQWKQMIRECNEVIALNPKTIKAYYNIADYYAELKQTDSMHAWMQKAYLQDSGTAEYYYYYGFLYKHLEVPDSSAYYFNKCIERSDKFPLAYFHNGIYYGNTGKYEAARDAFKHYIELAPADPNAYFYYGQALCVTGDVSKGCNYLKEADKRGVKEAASKINYYCR